MNQRMGLFNYKQLVLKKKHHFRISGPSKGHSYEAILGINIQQANSEKT